MKSGAFAFEKPASVEQALAAKSRWGGAARFLAGGQSLMPAMALRFNESQCLIDLNGLDDLARISLEGSQLVIGAMARHAKHPQNAVAFLNYLVSEQAQMYFADGNNEWPVVKGININNPALKAMGGATFKSEKLAASVVGMNQIKVQQMLDRVGFK